MSDTTTLFNEAKDKRLFAKIIIEFIEKQHQEYEREHKESGCERVPLANIHFGIVCALNRSFSGIGNPNRHIGVPRLQEIAKWQGKANENLLITAQRMLDLFCTIGEIEKYAENVYRLGTDRALYKHLTEKLEGTL